jgi:hypothetical protein
MNAIVTAIVGGLLLLVLGWIKLDLVKLSDKIDTLSQRITELAERVSRIEGRLDEREHHHP